MTPSPANRLTAALLAHEKAHGRPPPLHRAPDGVDNQHLAALIERFVADGEPMPDTFDWFAHLPPEAQAQAIAFMKTDDIAADGTPYPRVLY